MDIKREKILQVNDLDVRYFTPSGSVVAADKVNFYVRAQEVLGMVGESGCGKTTTAMAVLRMVQAPGRITGGEIILNGRDLVSMGNNELKQVRWQDISLVPQGAMNSLNPLIKIKEQLNDSILAHEKVPPKELRERIYELFRLVGLPKRIYDQYPHELSGGMKQRVCIAMAISLNPSIIIADEPTSALDVVTQKVVAKTLLDVKEQLGVSLLMIGHDMGLMAQMSDRIAVMYAGNVVEIGPVKAIFSNPAHPYTRLLIDSIPSIAQKKPLKLTDSVTHDLRFSPKGCIFELRCEEKYERCSLERPQMVELGNEHFAACHLCSMRNNNG